MKGLGMIPGMVTSFDSSKVIFVDSNNLGAIPNPNPNPVHVYYLATVRAQHRHLVFWLGEVFRDIGKG